MHKIDSKFLRDRISSSVHRIRVIDAAVSLCHLDTAVSWHSGYPAKSSHGSLSPLVHPDKMELYE
ncbi:hypothetical protein STEG23_012877, partial [Scotinomys teguina]